MLVLVKPDELNDREKNLLSKCKFLLQTPGYRVYELQCSTLQHLTDSLAIKTKNEFRGKKTYPIGSYYSTDSMATFVHGYFVANRPNPIEYSGKDTYSGKMNDFNVVYDGGVPNYKDSNYVFSFWMADFTSDLYPRSTMAVQLTDSTGRVYSLDYPGFQSILKTMDGNWALIEQNVKIRHASDKIKIAIWNYDLGKDKKLILDEFWLRPAATDIYRETPDYMLKNNRYYKI